MAKEPEIISEVVVNMSDEEREYVREVIRGWQQKLLEEVNLVQESYKNAMKTLGIGEELIKKVEKQTLAEYLKLTKF